MTGDGTVVLRSTIFKLAFAIGNLWAEDGREWEGATAQA
jgi:hypothetical protein